MATHIRNCEQPFKTFLIAIRFPKWQADISEHLWTPSFQPLHIYHIRCEGMVCVSNSCQHGGGEVLCLLKADIIFIPPFMLNTETEQQVIQAQVLIVFFNFPVVIIVSMLIF